MIDNKPACDPANRVVPGNLVFVKTVALLFVCLFIKVVDLSAQSKRMAAIGSSTTVGFSSTSADSCWFGRFSYYFKCSAGILESCVNYGVPGANVYAGMPTNHPSTPGRPVPDQNKNVTKAVSALKSLANPRDGVIIVNYPSNGYDTYSIAEIMRCLQVIYDSATASGNRCFITTTQPRTDEPFNNPVIKRKLAAIKDSTINRFGEAHTLNFWDGLYEQADSSILAPYSAGDNIHFNNLGHKILFERIIAKNVFGLPVWYAAATGSLNVLTTWGINPDGSGSHPTSFAGDNQVFVVTNNLNPSITGNWTLTGNNVRLIVGDGIKPVVFEIPPEYKVTVTSPLPPGNCQ